MQQKPPARNGSYMNSGYKPDPHVLCHGEAITSLHRLPKVVMDDLSLENLTSRVST